MAPRIVYANGSWLTGNPPTAMAKPPGITLKEWGQGALGNGCALGGCP